MTQDFVKQYDIKHKIQRLYVHWDVSTQCNFKCTYCYAMKDYGDQWGKIDNWWKQKLVINNIARAKLPVFLGLLGGEPTIHPEYEELIELCHNAISSKPDGRLYVTTNGSQSNEFFIKHKFYEQMYFLFSFHPEYRGKYGNKFEKFIDNIKVAVNSGFKCKVNVMLHTNEKFWSDTHYVVDELEKIPGLEIHPHFLYADGDVHKLESYGDEFYEQFSRFKSYPGYFTFEDSSGKRLVLNDYNIFQHEQTSFKGWDCWNNNYEISYDGVIHRVCFDEGVNALKDIFYFKNIEKVCPVKCPHTSCNCDGLLKIYKEKGSVVDKY
jgi:MoaA/NifB/PqqE/SkfB family radical SAM enzyme